MSDEGASMNHDDPLDDPRLTAHAMGEIRGEDGDPLTPEEQAEVDAIRATADVLRAGFAATPMPTLDPAHRAAILQGLSREPAEPGRGTVPGSVVRLSEYSGLGALAATLLLVIGFGIAGATGGSGGDSGLYVKTFSAPNYSGTYLDENLDWILKHQNPNGTWEVASADGRFNFSSVDIPPDVTVGVTGTLPNSLLTLRGSSIRAWRNAGGSAGATGGIQPSTLNTSNGNLFFGRGVGGGGGGVALEYFGVPVGGVANQADRETRFFGFGGNAGGPSHNYGSGKLNTSLAGKDSEIKAGAEALATLEASKNTTIADLRRQVSNSEEWKAIGPERARRVLAVLVADRERMKSELEKASGTVKVLKDRKASSRLADAVTGGAEDENMELALVGKAPAGDPRFAQDMDADAALSSIGYVGGYESSAESYAAIVENPWIRPYGEAALSTFSIDVDTAGYSIVRRCLVEQNRLPPPGALRVEELVNYFPYAYDGPATADPFAVHVDAAACPWEPRHRLVRIALKGREVEEAVRPAANLVFLLDVSGSMAQPNKLPLVKKSIEMLTERLTARDRVAMVVYAGNSGLVLPSTPAGDHAAILAALDHLEAGGSTNGGAGIELAYKVAAENFVPGGINRVVLATDGDFNVGVSDPSSLVQMVEEKAKSGVFLTALGYGMDNLKDSTLEQLADKGNGNYGYVDNLAEARKVLVEQGMSTLHCIAKDVKIQVEFNPAKVAGYRLLGYENRMLAAQDFADDRKDAGEIGAGHTVTALYEVVPAGVEVPGAAVDELRYQRPGAFSGNAESLVVKLRWKEPEGTVSTPREFPFVDAGLSFESASADFRFAAGVAAFGMVLRGSKEAGSADLDLVREIAAGSLGADPGGYRAEFVTLVEKAKNLKR